MGVDDDGVRFVDAREGGGRFFREVSGEGEVATIGGIDVEAEAVLLF